MLKALARAALRAIGLYEGAVLTRRGPLVDDGWLRSFREGTPVDAAGRPVPWLPMPAIEFLAERARPGMCVFEYGSGSSTLWWAGRVREVISCEHDREWYEKMRGRAPANVTLLHVPLERGGDYCRTAAGHPGRFDVVVIDGRDRVNCARNCVPALKPDGVVVWDNVERDEYAEGLRFLAESGFRRLDFAGMPPGLVEKTRTAVLYRAANVFGL